MINSNTLSGFVSDPFFFSFCSFVSSKLYKPQPAPLSHTGSFHRASSRIRKGRIWHAVKFNYRISFNTQGNYGAGLIAVNSTSCQRSSHTAVTQLQFGHTEIALNHTQLSAVTGSSLQHCSLLTGCYLKFELKCDLLRAIVM